MDLPTLSKDEIEQAIAKINCINLNETSIEEIKVILNPLFVGYTQNCPSLPSGIDLYRGIIYKKKPDNISFLSYPPKEFARKNRASRKNQPCFYSAISRNVPSFELGLAEGDTFALVRWKTKKELLVNHIGYTDDNFKSLNSIRESPKQNYIKNSAGLDRELNTYVHNYLATTFSQPVSNTNVNLYKLTIAIAEKLNTETTEKFFLDTKIPYANFDGILYPTIQMNANSDNIAIRQSFVDEGNLEFMEVEWIETKKISDSKFDVEVLDWANSISATGEIEWKGRLQLWDIFPDEGFYFTDENGRKIGKNKYGETIEPY